MTKTIPAKNLKDKLPQNAVILDVRSGPEHAACALVREHIHIPLHTLDSKAFSKEHTGKPIYVLCRSGHRAGIAAGQLSAAGHKDVHVIEGGILACQNCGEETTGTGRPLGRHALRIAAFTAALLVIYLLSA